MLRLLHRFREWWQARRSQRITATNARERVRRGAAYLDQIDPEWYRQINPETLELDDGRHCVLGQLHGEFRLGLSRAHLLNLSSAPRASLSPVAYGFKCVEGVSEEWQSKDYRLLAEAWKVAVRTRQAADSTLEPDDREFPSGDSLPEVSVGVQPSGTNGANEIR